MSQMEGLAGVRQSDPVECEASPEVCMMTLVEPRFDPAAVEPVLLVPVMREVEPLCKVKPVPVCQIDQCNNKIEVSLHMWKINWEHK